jgi:pimeloyl-ACP methyl ester carboxylesterase
MKKNFFNILLLAMASTASGQTSITSKSFDMQPNAVHYHNLRVSVAAAASPAPAAHAAANPAPTAATSLNIFYREAGPKDAPVILLLHGYPTSSFMFRNLIPILATRYHVIAPDLPGFGFSDAPPRAEFAYTFDHLAAAMQSFIDTLKITRFAVYIFDYGAPVGLRLALANQQKITAIITQNGNAYEQGLSTGWNPIQKYWKDPTSANRDSLKQFIAIDVTKFQYQHGVTDLSLIAPETYTLDQHFLDRPEHLEMQLDLLLDYRTNVALYPKFQAYFRDKKPMILAVWGNKDPYFLPAGAEGYRKDDPNTTVKFYDTGHFALETHAQEIGADILEFMGRVNP